ncbi:hypothetical protein [Halococcus sediminicola]|uniref:hypothetical protein n=1 Tax=Halococcus sediminicola TaxID=1264579 RepID=UPI00067990DC|nr:hypothetical protein [Halococcus sediminicola]
MSSDAERGDGSVRDVPDWDDEYVDRVSDRLMFNYDLERDHRVRGEPFTLYGHLRVESKKQFFHEALSYANHGSFEHLFVRRNERVNVAALETLVALGHDLGGDIDTDEEHFSTDFTFALVVETIPGAVEKFVAGFSDRTLLKYGYYGHYEINLLVVAPDEAELVASENADVAAAFRLWEAEEPEPSGLLSRIARLFG